MIWLTKYKQWDTCLSIRMRIFDTEKTICMSLWSSKTVWNGFYVIDIFQEIKLNRFVTRGTVFYTVSIQYKNLFQNGGYLAKFQPGGS